jgi:hypothetical protein
MRNPESPAALGARAGPLSRATDAHLRPEGRKPPLPRPRPRPHPASGRCLRVTARTTPLKPPPTSAPPGSPLTPAAGCDPADACGPRRCAPERQCTSSEHARRRGAKRSEAGGAARPAGRRAGIEEASACATRARGSHPVPSARAAKARRVAAHAHRGAGVGSRALERTQTLRTVGRAGGHTAGARGPPA